MIVEFKGEIWQVNTKEDFERMLWLSDSGLLDSYQSIMRDEEDEKEEYRYYKEEWEQLADGYHTAMNDVYNTVYEMGKYCRDTKKLDRNKLMNYIADIINTCDNVL